MPIGYKVADLKFQKKKPGLFSKIVYPLADIVLFRPIRSSLGLSNARICYTTGAVLSSDAFRFYHALESSSQKPVWDNGGWSSHRAPRMMTSV